MRYSQEPFFLIWLRCRISPNLRDTSPALNRPRVSYTRRDRPELARLLDHLRTGDVVTVTRLDRLARSTRDLLDIAEQIQAAGAGLRSLAEPWADTTSPAGRMVLTVFAGIAEFERSLIIDRTRSGRQAAKDTRILRKIDRYYCETSLRIFLLDFKNPTSVDGIKRYFAEFGGRSAYRTARWELALWGRNLFDKGFSCAVSAASAMTRARATSPRNTCNSASPTPRGQLRVPPVTRPARGASPAPVSVLGQQAAALVHEANIHAVVIVHLDGLPDLGSMRGPPTSRSAAPKARLTGSSPGCMWASERSNQSGAGASRLRSALGRVLTRAMHLSRKSPGASQCGMSGVDFECGWAIVQILPGQNLHANAAGGRPTP